MIKPWLWLPPQLAHDLSPYFLKIYGSTHARQSYEWRSLTWRGLRFANRLGIAGGVDKNAAQISDWWKLGPGFLEIGTVTPLAQPANPGRIMDRDVEALAIWNKMGFPNCGAQHALTNLKKLSRPYHTPVFVNIGKNRQTPNDQAAKDYLHCMQTIGEHADVFVINISSPNTTGLRDLQSQSLFKKFLQSVLQDASLRAHKPVLLKLSPDLSQEELKEILHTSAAEGIDGWSLTNTTLTREQNTKFTKDGGVSGKPLASLSKRALRTAIEVLGVHRGDRLLISVGGVLTAEDVVERLDLGADLVQVYSALVYSGPQFFKNVAKHIVS